ncbi:MAG: hypothetical protein GY859_43030, partial [Desulfobacterales bacterium]|nr:hypothetical protein [Desulfobacterales bacterium]
PAKATPAKATPAKKRKPAPTAPPESPPQGRNPNILTADIRPETDDPEPVRWKVSLYFEGRQIELKFLHPEGTPTLRRIMKRLSFETNSVLQAERESRRGETDERKRQIIAKLKEDERKLRYLLGEKQFKAFLNDERFLNSIVEPP